MEDNGNGLTSPGDTWTRCYTSADLYVFLTVHHELTTY